MIPILYESNETEFSSEGLGRLYDCISCTVTEERNGVYEATFEYPMTGKNFDKIYPGRIIGCEHDYSDDVQPFDIVSYSRPINGVVTFHAVHISYRQSGITVTGSNINSLSNAFTLFESGEPSNPFIYETDKTSTGYFASADGVPHSVRQMLGGMDGSILDTYGGEFEFDKFTVKLLRERGKVQPLTIRYGVNLLDYNETADFSATFNSVIPYWTGDDGNGNQIVVKGNKVESGSSLYNGRIDCVPLDLTDKFETMPTTAQLETEALSYLAANQTNLPSRSITVDFVNLQDSSEYKQFAPLTRCGLCDSVRLVFTHYNVEGTFKIVKIVYNVLLEKYDSIELGNLSTSLASALGIQQIGTFSGGSGGGVDSDYIVEEGTSGIWTYRKWASGIAECWGRRGSQNYAMTSGGGYAYYTSATQTLPTGLFTQITSATSDRCGGSTGNGLVATDIRTINTTELSFFIWVPASATLNVDVAFSIKGLWKTFEPIG